MVSPQVTQTGKSSNRMWARGDRCPCGPQDRCRCDGTVIEQCGCYRHELIAQGQHSGDSVRITADIRRQVLSEFFADALIVQRAVTEGERIDRKNSDTGVKLYTQADLKVRSAAAIQQWVASNLAAYADDNREFGASAVTR